MEMLGTTKNDELSVSAFSEQLPERILIRREDLESGIKSALVDIPVTVETKDRDILISFQELLICGLHIEAEGYKIYNASGDWSEVTTYHCEKGDDNTWYYYLESIDECIGETKRLVMFEAKIGGKRSVDELISFTTQIKKAGLDIPENWRGDPRNSLLNVFKPLIVDSKFELKINLTDSNSKILELYRSGEPRRIMGFAGKRDMSFNVFFNTDFYNAIKDKLDLPENEKNYRTQPHMNLAFEQVWNIICVVTGKKQYIEKEKHK